MVLFFNTEIKNSCLLCFTVLLPKVSLSVLEITYHKIKYELYIKKVK